MLGRSKSCTKALDLWSIQSSVSCGVCRESYFVADRKQSKSNIRKDTRSHDRCIRNIFFPGVVRV